VISLLTDDPGLEDRLGRGPLVGTMVSLLDRLEPPACVAVYGSWGAGKTSVLQQVKRRCEDRGQPTVWFDPWEHERRPDVLAPLILAIARARPEGAGKRVKLLALGLLKAIASLKLSFAAPLGAGFEISLEKSLGSLWQDAKDLERYRDEVFQIKEDFRALVDEIVPHADDRRLLIFLDDLDRCLPETAVALIEAVKLLLCSRSGEVGLSRVIFVFALDRHIVGEAIRHEYGGASIYTGENYLEKIFDFSVELPVVSKENASSFVKSFETGLGPFAQPLCTAIEKIPALANPRVIKRAINRLRLYAALPEKAAQMETLKRDDDTLRRTVLWVCGSERFRSFRHFLREAPLGELADVYKLMKGDLDARARLSPEGVAIVDAPGFRTYYFQLAMNQTGADAFHAHLRGVDDDLREIGL
jgi:hypothetical protein